MAADQVLSIEVVLPNGQFVTASATQNPNLFWALRGGGGSESISLSRISRNRKNRLINTPKGTFGVVTSLVIQAYPKNPVTTVTFSYAMSATLNSTTFWAGLAAYFKYFNTFIDAGTYGYFNIVPNGLGGFVFNMSPWWGNNLSKAQSQALIGPLP